MEIQKKNKNKQKKKIKTSPAFVLSYNIAMQILCSAADNWRRVVLRGLIFLFVCPVLVFVRSSMFNFFELWSFCVLSMQFVLPFTK